MPSAAYWHAEADGSAQCDLCPHRCRIQEGRSGICRVRRNEGGAVSLPYFGLLSALALDPIEKKPLHHFLPGSEVLSAGFIGCNMRCPFCQNWQISQELPSPSTPVSTQDRHTQVAKRPLRSTSSQSTFAERYSPETLVAAALKSGAPSIAYTYSEPTIHFEFVLASMTAARAAGLKNVLVTNGCINSEPARDLLALTDAVNIDLKTWSDEAYRLTLDGNKPSVLDFIRIASSLCHVEITTLVVPGMSDRLDDMKAISSFISDLSPDIPLHLSAYHPAWKHLAPPTSASVLLDLARAARTELRYVYIGNLAGGEADTLCPACGKIAISRRGYRIDSRGLAISGSNARCASCGTALPIIV